MVVPTEPLNVTAVRGNQQATVSWVAPVSNGGGTISQYTVTSNPGGFTATTPGTLNATVTGLTNGSSYTFTVRATNSAGTGNPSAASNAVIPATLPSAPGTPTASRLDSAASVSWGAPASTGGTPITGYTVTSSPGGFSATTTGAQSATVNGLTNGSPYTFTVVAINGVGIGPASAASNPVTPATFPGAPGMPTAVRGNAQATVSWTPPASTGGSPITNYTVSASPGGQSATGLSPVTVAGLANGSSYTFTVRASNVVGLGPPSPASLPVVPATVPGPPTAVTAIGGLTSATVSWIAPSFTGGDPLTGYIVTSQPGGFMATSPGPTTAQVMGLVQGQLYTFTVVATNTVGPSGQSAPSNPVRIGVDFNGVAGSGSNFGFAAGSGGRVTRYNGGTWTPLPAPTTEDLLAVAAVSTTSAWAVGRNGTAVRYSGGTSATVVSPGGGSDLLAIFANPQNGEYWAVGENGIVLQGNSSGWSNIGSPTANTLSAIWADPNGNEVFAGGELGVVLRRNFGSFQQQVLPMLGTVRGIAGDGSGDAFAIGSGVGVTAWWNGTSWQTINSGTNELLAIWSNTTSGDVIAVGRNGSALRWNGFNWTQVGTGTSNDLFAIHGPTAGGGMILAVGEGGTIVRYNGSSFSPMTSPTTEDLLAVWAGAGTTTAYAVGRNGTIVRYNGSTWSLQPSGF